MHGHSRTRPGWRPCVITADHPPPPPPPPHRPLVPNSASSHQKARAVAPPPSYVMSTRPQKIILKIAQARSRRPSTARRPQSGPCSRNTKTNPHTLHATKKRAIRTHTNHTFGGHPPTLLQTEPRQGTPTLRSKVDPLAPPHPATPEGFLLAWPYWQQRKRLRLKRS